MKTVSEDSTSSSLSLPDQSSSMFDDQDTDPQESDGHQDDKDLMEKRNGKPPLNPTRRASAPGALTLQPQSGARGGKKTTPPRPTATAGATSKKSSSSPFDAGRLSIIGGTENPILPSPQSSVSNTVPFESYSPEFDDGGGGFEDQAYGDDVDYQGGDGSYDYEPKPLTPKKSSPLPKNNNYSSSSSSKMKSVLVASLTSASETSTKQVTPKKKTPVRRHSVIPESDEEELEEAEYGSPSVTGGSARKDHRRISFASTIMDTPGSDEFPVGRQIDDDSYSEGEEEDNEGAFSLPPDLPLCSRLTILPSLSSPLLPRLPAAAALPLS
jgi:hypothetical protein